MTTQPDIPDINLATVVQLCCAIAEDIDTTDILDEAERTLDANFHAEALDAPQRGAIIVGIFPDASMILLIAEQSATPESDTPMTRWTSCSFPDLRAFGSFLHHATPELDTAYTKIPPTQLERLITLADKYILASSLEAGHA